MLGRTCSDQFLVWSHQWLARQGYAKRAGVNEYDAFIDAGELTVFDGGDDDIEEIAKLLQGVADSRHLEVIGIDAYGATGLAEALASTHSEVVAVPQGWRLTPALSWIERQLAKNALTHSGSKLMRWNIGNAIVTRVGNARSVTKQTAVGSGKIDGTAALLNAAAASLAAPAPVKPQLMFI